MAVSVPHETSKQEEGTHLGAPEAPLAGRVEADSWRRVGTLPPCPGRHSSVQRQLYYSRHPQHLGAQGFVRNYIVPLRGKTSQCLSVHDGGGSILTRPHGWNFFATPTHPRSAEARTYLDFSPAAPPEHFLREEMGVRIVCTEGILSVGMALPEQCEDWSANDENPSLAPCPGVIIWKRVCPANPNSISSLVSLGPGEYLTIPYHTWFFLENYPVVDHSYTLVFFAMRTVGAHAHYAGKTVQDRVLRYLTGECSVRTRDYEKLAKDYMLYFTNEESATP